MRSLVFVAGMLVSTAACALTSNAPPLDIRYFTVDVPSTTTTHSATLGSEAPRALAIGKVRASDFLKNRIVYRDANDVLGAYEQSRWTEYPEVYLRRFLAHALFDDDRFVQSLGRDVPTVDIELVAFEEVQRAGRRSGRVEVSYRLRAGDRVIASDIVTAERVAGAGAGLEPVVDALGGALEEVAAKVAASVAAELK